MNNNLKIERKNVGWKINESSRSDLLSEFFPKYRKVIGHHITYKMNMPITEHAPEITNAKVVGYSNDPEGLEALVVSINNDIIRPDGKIYHITWSLDDNLGFKPVDSNRVIAEKGWKKIENPINIRIELFFF